MLRPSSPRLLLLLPTVTYRTVAFVEAAHRLGADLTVASERPSTFERANPTGLVTLDFADPTHAAAQAREFARAHPVHGVVAVDDDTAVVAAAIAEALGLRGNPVAAAAAARDKHQQRQLLATAGVAVPRFELLTIAADPEKVASGVSYPCVLKPLRLSASRGVIRAGGGRRAWPPGRTDPRGSPPQRSGGVADRARRTAYRRAVQRGVAVREPGCGGRDAGGVARRDHHSARAGDGATGNGARAPG